MNPTESKRPACRSGTNIPKLGLKKISLFQFITCILAASNDTIGCSASPINKDYDICMSQGCNDTASRILKNMDPEINPCIDFYKFACGGFVNTSIIPNYTGDNDSWEITMYKINEDLRKLFEADIKSTEPKPFGLVKKFYKSCMNTTAIDAKRYEPLKEIMQELGGWPLVVGDTWDEDEFDWQTAMSKFRKIGDTANYFIDYGIFIDEKDNRKPVITLSQPSTSMAGGFQSYGVNSGMIASVYESMIGLAEILGADVYNASYELIDAWDFETELFNIISSGEELSDANLYNPMTIAELNANYPSIRWKDYINGIFPTRVKIENDDEVVFVRVPSYFGKLENLMSVTSKRIQANYVFMKFARSALNLIFLDGILSKKCVKIVREKLLLSVDAMYVREYVSEETRNNVAEIVTEIRQQMNVTLKQTSWMDEKTRKGAMEKTAATNILVGYPDELLDDNLLEAYYENLTLTEDNYFKNMYNLTSFLLDIAYGDLRETINKTVCDSSFGVTFVNAYNVPYMNSICIPAGILRDTIFSDDRPKYLNYGAVGTIIGHEITHTFDTECLQFDKDGNFNDWWEPSVKKTYLEHLSCIIEQYKNYRVADIGLELNGTRSHNENIADNGGVKLAYRAYVNWSTRQVNEGRGEEKRLPGLEGYTSRQMFWLSYANMWCEKKSEELIRRQVSIDPHSINEFRVIGVLSNMREFANDFGCYSKNRDTTNVSTVSKMLPERRCSVW